jgi:hypothetical protein
MRVAILCLMVALAGCTLRANRQASTPPAPNPDAVKPVVQPPLSIPQTSARLPSPQDVNPAAIPPEEPPEEPAAAPEKADTQPPSKNNTKRAAGPPPAKPAETPATPEPEAPAAAAPVVSETAPFQPIISTEQQNKLKTSIASRRSDIAALLAKAGEHPGNDQTQIDRIHSFLKLSEEAAQHGDYTQADALAERALILAQELKVE